MKPKLWILHATSPMEQGYDTYDSFVVRARTEQEAREFAAAQGADEQPRFYEGDKRVPQSGWLIHGTCELLKAEGPLGIVIASFNAG